jgi:hypothetical protein
MAALTLFLPLIRGRLPGCPDLILYDAVRDTSIEFCKRTLLLTETVAVTVVAATTRYTLAPTTGQHWELVRLRRDETDLEPSSREGVLTLGLDQKEGPPGYYYLEGNTQLVLAPVPDAGETLSALVTVRPADNATTIPDVLWSDYREPIAAGARAWVRRNYGDWINPAEEAADRALFDVAVDKQILRRARGGANTPLRVRSHPF